MDSYQKELLFFLTHYHSLLLFATPTPPPPEKNNITMVADLCHFVISLFRGECEKTNAKRRKIASFRLFRLFVFFCIRMIRSFHYNDIY